MIYTILLILTTMNIQSNPIFDFETTSDISDWRVVDDVVMGGRSSGNFYVSNEGSGIFEGAVSLENNGGFSSLRYRFNKKSTKPYTKIVLKVKGDSKTYQFRIKHKSSDYYSYITLFKTTTDWQKIEIHLSDMYPAFRGRKLNITNYDHESIEEIAFLIGNKKEESFKIEIDSITLE